MPSLLLHIENLDRTGCAIAVRRRLQELAGVTGVMVDPAAGTVRVLHDGTTEHDQVSSLLRRLGYPENGTGNTKEAAISDLTCAIGRLHGED